MSFHWKHKPSMHPKSPPPQPLLPTPPFFYPLHQLHWLLLSQIPTHLSVCVLMWLCCLCFLVGWEQTFTFPSPCTSFVLGEKMSLKGLNLASSGVPLLWLRQLFFCGVCYKFSRHILMLVYGASLCSSWEQVEFSVWYWFHCYLQELCFHIGKEEVSKSAEW